MSTTSYHAFMERVAAVTHADDRIAAALVGGSRGAGTADEHADIDLYLILRDDAYDDFFAARRDFMHRLGDPIILEDFNGFGHDMLLFLYADGVEGELMLARASNFAHIPHGPFLRLLDRHGILPAGAFPPIPTPDPEEQCETLRWMVHWFWRDLSQLSRWVLRDKLWTAYGHLEYTRHTCLNLARLQHEWGSMLESFHKLDGAAAVKDLAALQGTFCRVEREAMLTAVRALLALYLRIAPPLAAAHGIAYPVQLHSVVIARLEQAFGVMLDAPLLGAHDSDGSERLVSVGAASAALG